MKKVMVCIVLGSLLMTSCFSTRYVSAEPGLKKEFRGAWVEDVEFEFGEPGDIEDLDNGGYVYTYYAEPLNGRNREEYYRFLFDGEGRVRNVQSNQTVRQRKFNVGGTVLTIIFWTVIVPSGILLIASESGGE